MRALLVCMPFADPGRPALGLSTLKASLGNAGVTCDVAYPNLDFAARLGQHAYRRIAECLPLPALAGEWVFAEALRRDGGSAWGRYADEILGGAARVAAADVDALRRARSLAAGYLQDVLLSLPWGEYGLVGFTSSGPQNAAALALARLVKERHPGVKVAFGGHNWSGSTGRVQHRLFPWVDFAFTGEAERSLPALLRALDGDATITRPIPGVVCRNGRCSPVASTPMAVRQLDDVPTPDHTDYFARLDRSPLELDGPVVVPVELSRGCWWATKSACVFCSLNGKRPSYRAKSVDRMLDDLRAAANPGTGRVDIVDNVVPRRFLDEALPRLVGEPGSAGLSFKIRPDVERRHVESAAAARATLMCGIESLSSRLLRLLGKGVDAAAVVALLEWCAALGVDIRWNLLWGLPGERPEDYREQVDMMPTVQGFRPPDVVTKILLERDSALWRDAQQWGFGTLRPASAYAHVYPVSARDMAGFAYFFDHDYRPSLRTMLQVRRLATRVASWRARRRGC